MTLFYCKSVEEFSNIIQYDEAYQGSTLDDPGSTSLDHAVVNAKLYTAQGELEALLASRFNIKQLRLSNSEYLKYAHAVITWFHLEINGEGREIVRLKYSTLKDDLKNLSSIVMANGDQIETTVTIDNTARKRRSPLVAHRILQLPENPL